MRVIKNIFFVVAASALHMELQRLERAAFCSSLYCRSCQQSGHSFLDVAKDASIREDGYCMGVVITDANGDNRPEIHMAIDYLESDRFCPEQLERNLYQFFVGRSLA